MATREGDVLHTAGVEPSSLPEHDTDGEDRAGLPEDRPSQAESAGESASRHPTLAAASARASTEASASIADEVEPVDLSLIEHSIHSVPGDYVPLPPIENIAFAGAGGRGFIYCGVAEALDEKGILDTSKRIFGTSCGGIISAAIALGYRSEEIREILIKTDFGDFKKPVPRTTFASLVGVFSSAAADSLTVYNSHGLYLGDNALNWLEFLVYASTGDPNTTFRDLHMLREGLDVEFELSDKPLSGAGAPIASSSSSSAGAASSLSSRSEEGLVSSGASLPRQPNLAFKDLHIVACELNSSSMRIFNSRNTPDVRVADAVLASMSIPSVFVPKKIEIDGEEREFVDGNVVNEYPIGIGDRAEYRTEEYELNEAGANPATLGFRLDGKERADTLLWHSTLSDGDYDPSSALHVFNRLKSGATSGRLDEEIRTKYPCNTVSIQDMGVSVLDFESSPEMKIAMSRHGKKHTLDYLRKYRGCGTYYKYSSSSDKIENRRDATELMLIEEYLKVKSLYMRDVSVDTVRQEYLLKRLHKVAQYIDEKRSAPEYSPCRLAAEYSHDLASLDLIRKEHLERFEKARELAIAQTGQIRERLAVAKLDRDTRRSSKLLLDYVTSNDLNIIRFLLHRDNYWCNKADMLLAFEADSLHDTHDNLITVAAGIGNVGVLIELHRTFPRSSLLTEPGNNGISPLYRAAVNGQVESVKYLLRIGAACDNIGAEERSAVLGAAVACQGETLALLMNRYMRRPSLFDINSTLPNGSNILHLMFSNLTSEHITAIMHVFSHLPRETLVGLLSMQDSEGNTPMHFLTSSNKYSVLEFLYGLVMSGSRGNESALEVLQTNVKNNAGATPYSQARENPFTRDFYLRLNALGAVDTLDSSSTVNSNFSVVVAEPDSPRSLPEMEHQTSRLGEVDAPHTRLRRRAISQ